MQSGLSGYLDSAIGIEDLAILFSNSPEPEPSRSNAEPSVQKQSRKLLPPCKDPSNPAGEEAVSRLTASQNLDLGEIPLITNDQDIVHRSLPNTLDEYRPTELNVSDAATFTAMPEADNVTAFLGFDLPCDPTSMQNDMQFTYLDLDRDTCFVSTTPLEVPPQDNSVNEGWGLPMNEKEVTGDVSFGFYDRTSSNMNGHSD
ncbi:hypothetical protein FOXYS1_971 [Fusarium oxysporum]|uniref:Uncharacterized protein n=1 Tax=Fusarium oxysporum TaxID=5507 RepID=A0A8H5AMY5_FUSOX|nr:hypothetical protein FOXYS1_971 [Fusarium oxysporum]